MIRWQHIHIPRSAGTAITSRYTSGTEEAEDHCIAADCGPDVLKWAVLRNPLDRCVSICAYLSRKEGKLTNDRFKKWLYEGLPTEMVVNAKHQLLITETAKTWLTDDTWLLSYERLTEQLEQFVPKIGLRYEGLRRKSTTEHLPYFQYYIEADSMFLGIVQSMYFKDIVMHSRLMRFERPVQYHELQ